MRDVGEHLGFVRKEAPKIVVVSGASFYLHKREICVRLVGDIGEYLGFVRREVL
ncbi:MAG: hypothetical protein Q8J68_06795 [Methanolobus sp.]|uniref:hypothetical protein n=1 Tax=Methanolobus sp. TaxID=1874737 RepID=UPI00273179A0|nr:hypothetical protein [Methanolobus sp.]MDP2216970.1 hypothetical protein [Methanolobus sp.]